MEFPRSWKNLLHRVFRTLVFLYCLVVAGLYFFQEKLLFHPTVLPRDYKFTFLGLPFSERSFLVENDTIHSLVIRVPKPKALVLYIHGNAGDLSTWGSLAEALARRENVNVLIFDYPGFGKSGGKIRSESQLQAVAAAAYLEARKEAGALPLVIFGRSVGTGLAIRLAAENPAAALVLESPYLSLLRLAQKYYPWAPQWVLRYQLDSSLLMPQVKCKTLMLHGVNDEVIPLEEGKALAALAPKAQFVEIPGGHHNDLSYQKDYWNALDQFLASFSPSTL